MPNTLRLCPLAVSLFNLAACSDAIKKVNIFEHSVEAQSTKSNTLAVGQRDQPRAGPMAEDIVHSRTRSIE